MVNLTLQYLTVGIRQARTWKLLQPHVPELMQRVLFPLMCFGDEDQELWDDDPLEYIRKVPGCARSTCCSRDGLWAVKELGKAWTWS